MQVIGVDPLAPTCTGMGASWLVSYEASCCISTTLSIGRLMSRPVAWRSRPAGLYDPVGGEREGDPVTPEHSLRGNVILIVEDDAETMTALAQLIANGLGCRVLTALSGYEALGVIDSGVQVDLVFADVVMPEMDGMRLAFLIGRRLGDSSCRARHRPFRRRGLSNGTRRYRPAEAVFA